ncbi:glycosyltransferase family A protein [Rufibacter immobilis]|uniref:glycosyltransferase family A protein n=1 Tax=Rufibacter immobilis TaxID=1348778 RepID=UPI0035E8C16D
MSIPLVSIIMPAYNAGKYIEQAIESVLNQTYPHWELLIINDGSIDETQLIIDGFSDSRIQSFVQENKGVSAARNVGLANMKGKYFTFLDADDLLPSDSLRKRAEFLQTHPEVIMLAGAVVFFEGHKENVVKVWKTTFKGNPLSSFIRLDEAVFCNPSLMIRFKENTQYKFLEGMTHVEDLLFFTCVARFENTKYESIEDVIYYYRTAESSAMSNLPGLDKGYTTFYEQVKQLGLGNSADLKYLQSRIFRIMFMSFLKSGDFMNALTVLIRFFLKSN